AVELVIPAGAVGLDGEALVLDMGEPVKIVELAREMIRLAGHHDDEIESEFSGLRAGEKLYEELLADGDATVPTLHPRLRLARLQAPSALPQGLPNLVRAEGAAPDDADVKAALRRTTQLQGCGQGRPTSKAVRAKSYRGRTSRFVLVAK
ncbi:MAG: polysaccharide biosynthesis protein, partial [Armatimonadota bacterium]